MEWPLHVVVFLLFCSGFLKKLSILKVDMNRLMVLTPHIGRWGQGLFFSHRGGVNLRGCWLLASACPVSVNCVSQELGVCFETEVHWALTWISQGLWNFGEEWCANFSALDLCEKWKICLRSFRKFVSLDCQTDKPVILCQGEKATSEIVWFIFCVCMCASEMAWFIFCVCKWDSLIHISYVYVCKWDSLIHISYAYVCSIYLGRQLLRYFKALVLQMQSTYTICKKKRSFLLCG